jgi:hypothetical protein
MRTLAVLLLLAPAAFADEVDLTPRSRSEHKPASLVVRGEGGTAFAPFGYLGGCISWLTASKLELELGAGGGFPGLQLGIAARQLFGERGGYLLLELAIAGNTRVNRVANSDTQFSTVPGQSANSAWTNLGVGFEQRQDNYSLSLAADIVFSTSSLTPHWALHGGVGIGF